MASIKENMLGIVDYFKSLGTYNITDIGSLGATSGKVIIKTDSKQNAFRQNDDSSYKELNLKGKKEVDALIRQTQFTLNERKDYINTLKKLRANDIAETIIDVMIDDGLVVGSNNSIFGAIQYINEDNSVLQDEIQKDFDDLTKKLKPDRVVYDFIDEGLLLGEYILPLEINDTYGVIGVKDNPDMDNMVCIYKGFEKEYFLQKKSNTVIQKLHKDHYVHFVLNDKKLRVSVKDFSGKSDESYTLEEYIKVGRSVLFPVINKIKQLQTLEMANLASDLREILKPTIIQVGLPEKTPPEKIGDIIERYEMIFSNIFAGLNNLDELNFSDLLGVITQIKVLPTASDNRGGFVKPDLIASSNNPSEREQNIRRSIALTVGLPFYYLSVSDNPTNRLESLKLFARYARKLTTLQGCIIEGIKEIYCTHIFYKKKIKINPDNIKITMREIVNIELLDKMDYLVSLMAGLEEIIKLVSTIEESQYINVGVNSKVLLEILNKNLGEFQGFDNLFVERIKKQNNPEQNNIPFSEGKNVIQRFKDSLGKTKE